MLLHCPPKDLDSPYLGESVTATSSHSAQLIGNTAAAMRSIAACPCSPSAN